MRGGLRTNERERLCFCDEGMCGGVLLPVGEVRLSG